MAKKQKAVYPNPRFWKAKDNIDWKKQGKNLAEVGAIAFELIKETDWQKFGQDRMNDCKADWERVKDEYQAFMALDNKEKWDRVVNGERSLGRLYRKGAMATVRREWRGVKDTAYDFYEWARLWGMLLMTFSRDLIPAMNSALWYRWMISYFCCHGFMDKNILGLRGSNLRMSHELTYQIFRYVAENLVLLSKADRKNGNSNDLNRMMVTFDEMTMGQIMAGFPDLCGIPHQLLPMFLARWSSTPCPTWAPASFPVPCPATAPPWRLPTSPAASRISPCSTSASPSAIWMRRPCRWALRTSRRASSGSKSAPARSGPGTLTSPA